MIAGRLWPQLGGDPRYLGVLGVNYYLTTSGSTRGRAWSAITPSTAPSATSWATSTPVPAPLLLAETGAQDAARAPWLAYIGEEVRAAMRAGVPVAGICIYPILDYPGWADDRHCACGLWGFPRATGEREVHPPLARELERQMELFQPLIPERATIMLLMSEGPERIDARRLACAAPDSSAAHLRWTRLWAPEPEVRFAANGGSLLRGDGLDAPRAATGAWRSAPPRGVRLAVPHCRRAPQRTVEAPPPPSSQLLEENGVTRYILDSPRWPRPDGRPLPARWSTTPGRLFARPRRAAEL